ncbi:MAG TPA: carbon-nitrogen hydrolase family protein [Smithella sp.]|nr:carbon-nitrogen hydrolase family protein [Smithella sp.]
MKQTVKAAAIQLAVKIGDASANIDACERLARQAVREGAVWIALPEFFTTGVSWNPKIADAIQGMDGPAANFLRDFSAKHQLVMGGSFLCRLSDGRVRNRYLCYAAGTLVGRHDKDLPTMWENYFYEGGEPDDSGILGTYENIRIGAAVCWEFMRTMTARRLRGQVDVVMGGSCWWSIPTNFPKFVQRLWEPANQLNAIAAVQDTARLIGAPVIHASHCGMVECPMPGLPIPYKGYFEGNAAIVDANGNVLARRHFDQGEGIVCADIQPGAREVAEPVPGGFWLRSRGPLPVFAWHHQRWLGRRWYKRHVRKLQRPICKRQERGEITS